MARARKTQPRIIATRPDATIANAPDANAGAEALREHYKLVQTFMATRAYDVFAYVCHWCLKDEQEYPHKDDPRGQRVYCSVRCQEAAAACHTHKTGSAPVTAELMERGEPKRRVQRRLKETTTSVAAVAGAPRKRGRHRKDCMCERHGGAPA